MKIVALSDSHNKHNELEIPLGDILIHAGDSTNIGRLHELENFSKFINSLPHRHKIVIAGNHDPCYEKYNPLDFFENVHYLVDKAVVINGISIYGSPWNASHWAYHCDAQKLEEKWRKIPTTTDILVTHIPPKGILDFNFTVSRHEGCKYLLIHKARYRFTSFIVQVLYF